MTRWLHNMLSAVKNRLLLKWLAARIPGGRRHSLNMQSVFIMPTLFGGIYFVLCLALFVLGTNYQNNLLLLLCYFFITIALLHMFISYQNFARLQIQAKGISTVYAGDDALFHIQIASHSHHRPSGLLNIKWWGHQKGIVIDLDEDKHHISLPRSTYRRGVFSLPRVTFSSDFPLGLFRCWTHLDFAQPMTVFPALEKHSLKHIPHQTISGDGATRAQGLEDFENLRTYQDGDPIQRIAWKSLACGNQPMIKSFSEPASQTLQLSVNPASRNLEQVISRTAYQVVELSRIQRPFSLQIGSHSYPASSGREHRDKCLRALSTIGTSV